MSNEKLTSDTPVALTIIVILLAVLRIAVWYTETFNTQEKEGIKWQQLSKVDLVGERIYQPKLVFYYFCEDSQSCTKVSRGALLNKQVVKLVNDNFLPIRVLNGPEAEGTAIVNLNKEFQQKLGVFMYPTIVITLPNGKEVGALPGYFGISANNLLSFIRYSQQKAEYVSGLDHLAHAQYDLAAKSFSAWLQTEDKTNLQMIDAALYCALAYRMIFEEDRAKEILATIRNAHYAKDTDWPRPLVQFLSGGLDRQALLQKCRYQENKESQAFYFIGMLNLRNNNIQDAVNNFKQAERSTELSPEIHSLVTGQLSTMFGQKN